jgi:hypothetical protein
MINLHVSWDELSGYDAHALTVERRREVRHHLAHCSRCRTTLAFARELKRRTTEMSLYEAPRRALEVALQRRAAGERVLVPAAVIRKSQRVPRIAAVIAFLLFGGALLLRTGGVTASASVLNLEPVRPTAGMTIQVSYWPTIGLGTERSLVLRARFRTASDEPYAYRVRHVMAAELQRGSDGVFRGEFALPDSVVYASFAIENAAATQVDARAGRLWELMVHHNDVPTFAALEQRIFDHMGRSWEEAHGTARQMARLYPDHPRAWTYVLAYERDLHSGAARDSLYASHRARFEQLHEQYRPEPSLPEPILVGMDNYAMSAGTVETSRYWSARLASEYPLSPYAMFNRLSAFNRRHRDDRAAVLAELEQIWREIEPRAGQAYRMNIKQGYQLSEATDVEAYRRWVSRFDRYITDRWAEEYMAEPLLQWESSRTEGIDRLQARIERLRRVDAYDRDLMHTIEEQRRANAKFIASAQVALAGGLLDAGRSSEALRVLTDATRQAWDPVLFQQVISRLRQHGDTVGIVQLAADIAADPMVPQATRDSLRSSTNVSNDVWSSAIENGSTRLRQVLLAQSTSHSLPSRVRLTAPDGAEVDLRALGEDGPFGVVFWKRSCGGSLRMLPELTRAAQELTRSGLRLLVITEEKSSAGFATFVRDQQLGFPIYHDTYGDAAKAFNSWATPDYYVVDGSGRVRFRNSTLPDLPRQLFALQPSE